MGRAKGEEHVQMVSSHEVLAYLNEHGEPVTLPNQEGELSTPSVVLFDKEEVVVGTEALFCWGGDFQVQGRWC